VLSVERVRAAESYFRPSLLGRQQAGIDECLATSLAAPPLLPHRRRLAREIVLCGGALLPGTARRIGTSLRRALPIDVAVRVQRLDGGVASAWLGARRFWSTLDNDSSRNAVSLMRATYLEHGSTVAVPEHKRGNRILPTPVPPPGIHEAIFCIFFISDKVCVFCNRGTKTESTTLAHTQKESTKDAFRSTSQTTQLKQHCVCVCVLHIVFNTIF
jgi:hypothetical protein